MAKIDPLNTLSFSPEAARPMSLESCNEWIRENEGSSPFGLNNYPRFIEELLIDSGSYKREEKAIWIYEQGSPEHYKTGIIALTEIEEDPDELIPLTEIDHNSPYENTQADDFITCAFYPSGRILQLIGDIKRSLPSVSLWEGTQRHRLWKVEDNRLSEELRSAFAQMNKTMLLNGEALLIQAKRKGWKQMPAYFIPYYDIEIESSHIYIPCKGRELTDGLLYLIKEYFNISELNRDELYRPIRQGNIGMYLRGRWHRLSPKKTLGMLSHIPDQIQFRDKILLEYFSDQNVYRYPDSEWSRLTRDLQGKTGYVAFSFKAPDRDQLLSRAGTGELFPTESIIIGPKILKGILRPAQFTELEERVES